MTRMSSLQVAAILLLAGVAAQAAPAIPSSELPGRERYRFQESPVERFMQPTQKAKPLIEWQCDATRARRTKKRPARKEC